MTPYYADDSVALYHGDCREIVPALGLTADCIVTDPPYGETSLVWDRWPDGWPDRMRDAAHSMWCFGSLRTWIHHGWDEFARAGWTMSQDIVWEKHNGSGFATDRFKRVHELAVHWYHGAWSEIHHDPPREVSTRTDTIGGRKQPTHTGRIGSAGYDYGRPLARSVLRVHSMHGKAIHPTEKPVGVLDPLIRYACPPGGVVLDPFAGSGSTAEAARGSGRRCVLVESREDYCELIVRRLAQGVLEGT